MRFTPEVTKRIADRFNSIAPGARCPLCKNAQFTVAHGLTVISMQNEYPLFIGKGSGGEIPCAALVCNVCGNTNLINLITIGLGDLLKPGY
jgi:hypothetical protein